MKEEILITERPEEISFDDLHQLLWKANEKNREAGFVLQTSQHSGSELADKIGSDGQCFVATIRGQLAGTLSIKYVDRQKWYHRGKIPEIMLVGVLPEYTGQHITTKLMKRAFAEIKAKGYSICELDTAENNTHAIEVYKHLGFQLADYKHYKNTDHNSVVMVRWDRGGSPYKQSEIRMRFLLRKCAVRMKRKIRKEK